MAVFLKIFLVLDDNVINIEIEIFGFLVTSGYFRFIYLAIETFNYTMTTFDVPEEKANWKHYVKMRKF